MAQIKTYCKYQLLYVCVSVYSVQVQIFNPAFFKYIHDHWTKHHGRYPSTGMLVLFFALHVCDEVSNTSVCLGSIQLVGLYLY